MSEPSVWDELQSRQTCGPEDCDCPINRTIARGRQLEAELAQARASEAVLVQALEFFKTWVQCGANGELKFGGFHTVDEEFASMLPKVNAALDSAAKRRAGREGV